MSYFLWVICRVSLLWVGHQGASALCHVPFLWVISRVSLLWEGHQGASALCHGPFLVGQQPGELALGGASGGIHPLPCPMFVYFFVGHQPGELALLEPVCAYVVLWRAYLHLAVC